jgi:hypothetical protein
MRITDPEDLRLLRPFFRAHLTFRWTSKGQMALVASWAVAMLTFILIGLLEYGPVHLVPAVLVVGWVVWSWRSFQHRRARVILTAEINGIQP